MEFRNSVVGSVYVRDQLGRGKRNFTILPEASPVCKQGTYKQQLTRNTFEATQASLSPTDGRMAAGSLTMEL